MLAQLIASGIAHGAIYALIALAMTVVYRATTVVNFGHGDMVMGGAFVVYVLVIFAEMPYPIAILGAIIAMFAFGMFVQRGLIRPLGSAPHLTLAMMTVAVSFLLRGIARAVWGREVLPMPSIYPAEIFEVGGVILTAEDLIITGVVLALVVALFVFFQKTRTGKLVQAVFQNERGAALVGVNVPSFHARMWGVGAALGAVGGLLIAPVTLLYPDMGAHLLIRGFAAMTLGGFGSLAGAVLGGFSLGVAEQLAGVYVHTVMIDITAYLVIIAVLIIRPAGLLGRQKTVRV